MAMLAFQPAEGQAQSAPTAPPAAPGAHDHATPTATPAPPVAQSPFVPPVTDADRQAAFPDVDGHPPHDSAVRTFVLFDQLEWQAGDGRRGVGLDTKGWIGGDLDRFWFRAEGERTAGRVSDAQLHLLYGRAIARWWDIVAGVRQDARPGPGRTWAAVGVQGLAPYWFEVEATAYVGEGGRTRARVEVEYELLLTNRLVLQPLLELEIHGKADPETGIGAGLSRTETGVRLRYEIRRELAPYVGISWDSSVLRHSRHGARGGRERRRCSLGCRYSVLEIVVRWDQTGGSDEIMDVCSRGRDGVGSGVRSCGGNASRVEARGDRDVHASGPERGGEDDHVADPRRARRRDGGVCGRAGGCDARGTEGRRADPRDYVDGDHPAWSRGRVVVCGQEPRAGDRDHVARPPAVPDGTVSDWTGAAGSPAPAPVTRLVLDAPPAAR